MKEKIRRNKKYLIAFALILVVGIFLRTYKFHDWLKFSHDQARDERIVSNVLEGKAPLPLLGPNAGGTKFNSGPIYYYFAYVSEAIFGNHPEQMAYPVLFFAILAIPMLFIFLREYFDRKISLALTALLSVSYFFVFSSRFSSNPNLIPFFLLLNLFAFLKIMISKGKALWGWSVVAGLALGIGLQLHTVYLTIMPVVTLGVFAYLFFKKFPTAWKSLLIIIAVSLLVNIGQIISETQTGWQNSRNFLAGFEHKSKSQNNMFEGVLWTASCQIRTNIYFVSSLQHQVRCDTILNPPSVTLSKNIPFYENLAADILFSFFGYLLLWRAFKKEPEQGKRNFLALIALLNAIAFIEFLFVANVLYINYFIVLSPIPFVLLGFYFDWMRKKIGKHGEIAIIIVTIILILTNLARDQKAAVDYQKGRENNIETTTLGDIEAISHYILLSTPNVSKVYLSGDAKLAARFHYPIEYFMANSGKEALVLWHINDSAMKPGIPIFYIKNGTGKIVPGQTVHGHAIISGRKFFMQEVILLKN